MPPRPKPSGIRLPMPVWDIATRLFHWSVVVLLIVSYVSISIADGPRAALWMRVHLLSGETMLGLLLFRLIWGLIGSDTARFRQFLHSPFTAIAHLAHIRRREPDSQVGHNAAGGWMVIIMLALLGIQVVTGLFANDDGADEGPLAHLVAKTTSDWLSGLHGQVFNLVAAAVALHLVAIIAYLALKGHNLTRAMITGKKRLPAITAAPRMASPLLAAATLAVSAGVAVLISRL